MQHLALLHPEPCTTMSESAFLSLSSNGRVRTKASYHMHPKLKNKIVVLKGQLYISYFPKAAFRFALVISIALGSISIPTNLRFIFIQAMAVDPPPTNGSST